MRAFQRELLLLKVNRLWNFGSVPKNKRRQKKKNCHNDLICIINPQFFPKKGFPNGGAGGGGAVFWEKLSMLPYFFWIDPLSIWNIFLQLNHMAIPSAIMLHMLDYGFLLIFSSQSVVFCSSAHHLLIIRSLSAHHPLIIRSSSAHHLLIICSSYAHHLLIICSSSDHHPLIICS